MEIKILFVSPRYNPFDGTGFGSIQRTNLLFEACRQLGHVDVITFIDNVVSTHNDCSVIYSKSESIQSNKESRLLKGLNMLAPWNLYKTFPKIPARAKILSEFLQKKKYDLIVCRYIPDAMECGLYEYAERLVIDVDDNPIDVERSASRTCRTLRNRLYHRYRACIMKYVLSKIQDKCKFTFYSNPAQAIYGNSAYLPNIPFYEYDIKCAHFANTTNRLLFVGNMDYYSNKLGIMHFVQEIFPLVQKEIPDVELHLVGSCNDELFLSKCISNGGVQYMGFVNDLKIEYEQARVVVVPIYSGAGTNIKVLEAMKMLRPCVTTRFGIRGFENFFHHGKEIFVTNSDQQFANGIIDLLSNEKLNHEISINAHTAVTEHFSRDTFNFIVKNSLVP